MLISKNVNNMTVYIDINTKNKSFLDMHYYLKAKKIKNNDFFLTLYDPDLAGVDPRDLSLNTVMKAKILQECRRNFWYFLREVIRIPDQGGEVGSGVPYRLHRGNLALNFGFINNWSMYLELPRQFGKTISAICWYLWVFNFRTTNSEIMFINMKHDYSKLNLARLKEIREALPSYLKLDQVYSADGTKKRVTDRVETLQHPANNNKIKTLASATSKAGANGLGRGLTMPMHWYDEIAWIKFNSVIMAAATPSYLTASKNARRNGAPYGILLTSTPGILTTDEGKYAYNLINNATHFDEQYYDYSYQQLQELLSKNTKSPFVYIRYAYNQLGEGDEYLQKCIKDLLEDWDAIRREVLLEWADINTNCPFDKDDLDKIQSNLKDPNKVSTIMLCGYYKMYVYEKMPTHSYPPIIGVDVAGGYSKDSSAITIIDSKTTKVIACLNCNYISIEHLAACIYELVTRWMPNAIVNIERNGGFGSALLAKLINTKIRRNIYFEIKDRVLEERSDGIHTRKVKKRVKVYGSDNTKENRSLLMELLRDRVSYHKDKFNSDIIYNELKGLEIKKTGRIEHGTNTHDDQTFSYLWALYVWYYGKDVLDNWGLYKTDIECESSHGEELIGIDESDIEAIVPLDENPDDPLTKSVNESITIQEQSAKETISYEQWLIMEQQKDYESLKKLLSSPEGRRHMRQATGVVYNENDPSFKFTVLPDEIYDMESEDEINNINGNYLFNNLQDAYKSKNKL